MTAVCSIETSEFAAQFKGKKITDPFRSGVDTVARNLLKPPDAASR